jgi:TPP-dependent pyruvate/acetoin dehydrogenase alpha subunit
LIELVTYRLNPHSSSDDDARYRLKGEMDEWIGKDPIPRFEAFLLEKGVLSPPQIDALKIQVEADILEATKIAQETPLPNWQTLIEGVYAEIPAPLQADLDDLLAYEQGLSLPHPGAFPL